MLHLIYAPEDQPYMKPKDTPNYINFSSNHSPYIIKALRDSISKRWTYVLSANAYLTCRKDLPPSNKAGQEI